MVVAVGHQQVPIGQTMKNRQTEPLSMVPRASGLTNFLRLTAYHIGNNLNNNGNLEGHGHGMYLQNDTVGTKKIHNNIIFSNYGNGIMEGLFKLMGSSFCENSAEAKLENLTSEKSNI